MKSYREMRDEHTRKNQFNGKNLSMFPVWWPSRQKQDEDDPGNLVNNRVGSFQDVFDNYFVVRIENRVNEILETRDSFAKNSEAIEKIKDTPETKGWLYNGSKRDITPLLKGLDDSIMILRKNYFELKTDCKVLMIFIDKFLVGDSECYSSSMNYHNKQFLDNIPVPHFPEEDYVHIKKPLVDGMNEVKIRISEIGTSIPQFQNEFAKYIDDPLSVKYQPIEKLLKDFVTKRNFIKKNILLMLSMIHVDLFRKDKLFTEFIRSSKYKREYLFDPL